MASDMNSSLVTGFMRSSFETHLAVIKHYGEWAHGGEPERVAKEWEQAGFSVPATLAALDQDYEWPDDAAAAGIDKDLEYYSNFEKQVLSDHRKKTR